MNVVYVTGNENKARLFNKMVGFDLDHVSVDVPEIQSLDISEVIEYKAKAAYEILKRPVLVEDTTLIFTAMNGLPGPLIKWFIEQLTVEGLCRMLDAFDDRSVVAGAAIAYYDGEILEIFEKSLLGFIATNPRGDTGFGWNPIFIPVDNSLTLGEMDENKFAKHYRKIKPFDEVARFLRSIDKTQA